MAISGTVYHDLRGLEARLRLHPKELLAADVRTKNKVAAQTRTEAVRRLRPDLPGLKARAIRNQLKLKRASAATPVAMLDFTPKRFRLFGNWNVSQTKKGVRLSRPPWRLEALDGDVIPPQALAHAFIQRAKSGPQVLLRVGTKRYPLTAIYAASLATAYKDLRIGDAILAYGRARFRIVLAQEMKYRIAKRHGLVLPGSVT